MADIMFSKCNLFIAIPLLMFAYSAFISSDCFHDFVCVRCLLLNNSRPKNLVFSLFLGGRKYKKIMFWFLYCLRKSKFCIMHKLRGVKWHVLQVVLCFALLTNCIATHHQFFHILVNSVSLVCVSTTWHAI